MIHPAPTTAIDPKLARGVLEEVVAETPTKPGYVVVGFANTSYRVHLLPVGAVRAKIGKRIIGVIRAEAKRVDVCDTGGRFLEPVIGRPRRVAGRVIATDEASNEIVVHAGVPVHLKLTDVRQRAGDFEIGSLVTCGVLDGASIEERAV